ncbi:hypothetical protein [Caulobacter sp. NIBR1757]|uniref:hypothetical protein n=1 Tax=Caulobacter sp. NIBR1757 TaxID=3016000 RepID=UPI0022F11525|nr:hypothetical protein [Caulobacter sp. NIBR1757]WGM38075.1 hypothetical protein AMEJIAPC_00976 [Caulobacter sp. NIBR1757]
MPTVPALVGFIVMAAVCLYALLRGGRPEKTAGVVIAVAWAASALLQDRINILSPQWAVAWLDVVLFMVFLGMTLRWRRGWLIFASATQLLTAATHFTQLLDPRLFALAVITAYYVWSYATLIALAWGTHLVARRQ